MKIFVLAAVLLIVGLGLAFLLKGDSADGNAVDGPLVIELPTADQVQEGTVQAPVLGADEDKLSAPTGAEPVRAGVETATTAKPTIALSGTVQVAPGCGDDDRIDVYALAQEGSMNSLSIQLDWHERGGAKEEKKDNAWDDDDDELPPSILARARVKPDMTFTLALPAGTEKAHLLVRGHYAYTVESMAVRVEDPRLVVVSALCGAAIEGTVWTPPGMESRASELEGLRVRVSTSLEGGATNFGEMAGTRRVARVREGKFAMDAIDWHTGYDLEIEPTSMAAANVKVGDLAAGRTKRAEIVLQRGGTLRGIVQGPGGVPLAGATVEAKRKGRFFGFDDEVVRSRVSSADGTFELAAVAPGRVLLSAKSDGMLAGDPMPVDVTDGAEKSGLVVALGKGKSITGLVTWTDGTPAAGASIDVEFDKSQMAGMNAFNAVKGAKGKAESDAQGQFTVSGLGAGPFTVRAEALTPEDAAKLAGASKLERKVHLQRARKDNVKPGSKQIALVLSAPIGIRGRVLDAQEQPIAKFHAKVVGVGQGLLGDLGQDEVERDFQDEAGAFQIDVPHTGAWKVTVSSAGYADSTPLEIAVPAKEGDAPIVITLQKAAIVRGVVHDPHGVPVVGATVEITNGEPNWRRNLPGVKIPTTKSGAEGTFTLEGLAPGSVALVADSDQWAKSVDVPVELAAGDAREGVVIVLREGGKLTGEVYETGKPASGLLVQATLLKSSDQKAGMTDAQGKFELAHLEPGSYQVIAMPMNALEAKDDGSGIDQAAIMSKLKMTSATIEDGKETHVVMGSAPKDPVEVRGRVTHAGGPFKGATVMFFARGKDVLSSLKAATTGDDGSYSTTLDGPGEYGVTVQRMQGDGTNQSSIDFSAKVPEQKEYELDLAMPTGRISGLVRGDDGAPAAGVTIQIGNQDGASTGTLFGGQYHVTSTGADGHYDFDVVRPGKYTVSAGGDPFAGLLGAAKHAREAVNVSLDEGEWQKNVDFRLEKPGIVVVTVVDERGDVVKDATIFARDPEGRPVDVLSMIASGSDGTAKYSGLGKGRHTFSARTKELACTESQPVDVESGETKTVKLTLVAGTRLLVNVVDKDSKPVPAQLSVTDEAGREMATMIGMSEIQDYISGGADASEATRVGPLGPGKYKVKAVRADGKVEQKSVSVSGGGEKKVTLRFDD